MSRDPHHDVIIIGAGVVGCAAALALARRGLRVVIADRGPIGREASWAGAGILSPGNDYRTDPMVRLVQESIQQYPDWTAQLREETGLDPQYLRCGRLALCFDDRQLRMAESQCQALEGEKTPDGSSVLEMLTPQQVREHEPAVTGDLLGAMRCTITAQVRNPRLMRALHIACARHGVLIQTNTPIQGLLWDADRVIGVCAAGRQWHAATTVLAAGAWSCQLDSRIAHAIPVYPVRGQILLLEHLPRLFSHVIERGKCYLVCRQDGKIIVGATEEHDSGYDKRTTADGIAQLLATATRMMPALASATFVRSWAGLRPGTPGRRPYIGPVPGVDGLLVATGHFRTGLTLAPVTARILADLICDGRSGYDLNTR